MDIFQRKDTGMRALLVAAATVVLIAGLKAASSVIVPFLASALIAVMFLPAVTWLQGRKVPNWAAVPLVFTGVLCVFAGLSLGLGASVAEFNANLNSLSDQAQERFQAPIDYVTKQAASYGYEISLTSLEQHFDPKVLLAYFGNVAGIAAETLSDTFFILLTVAFILGEAAGFPAKLSAAFGGAPIIAGETAAAVQSVRSYLRIKTEVSLATGALATLLTAVVGLDFPILWGVVAFALNFVPNIGSMIAAVPPVLLAVVQLGWNEALWVLVGYTAINTVIGNVVEPNLMGRKLGLSSLVVWLSLVFWGWVWGPIGMLLSVPLTMLVKILLGQWDDLRWVSVLLGPGGETLEDVVVLAPASADPHETLDAFSPPPAAVDDTETA